MFIVRQTRDGDWICMKTAFVVSAFAAHFPTREQAECAAIILNEATHIDLKNP